MAATSDLKSGASVVWATERPYVDIPRRSSNFWFLDDQYYLQFILKCSFKDSSVLYYSLTLVRANRGNKLLPDQPKFNVETFIKGQNWSTLHGSAKYANTAEQLIWSANKNRVDDTLGLSVSYGTWTTTCVLTTERPLTVRQSGSETVTLSTQTDLGWPSRLTSDVESLPQDLSKLLEQNSYQDVQLTCGGRTFSAHRNILTARSDVFAAMFRNKMAEDESGTVDVTDMDAEDLGVLLKYVYSGKLPDLSFEAASHLYVAGDKYRIQGLREACSELMSGWLTPDNCLSSLVQADAHNDDAFKERVVDFIATNLKLLKKNSWYEFNKDHPGLAISVYQKRFARALPDQD